ncbi:hypothetical protein J4477_05025 [Candidatus Pacearchaeota archaeon]|nr:hypothetical protein [Candidatus Pacearchaeota archaeon]
MKNALTPRTNINSEGKIAYHEGFQAWNTIRLKKELFEEFPQLKEKRSKFSYKLIYPRDVKAFEEFIKEIKKSQTKTMPILMWLYKVN